MTTCLKCQHDNRVGVLLCEKCGTALASSSRGKTANIAIKSGDPLTPWGDSYFGDGVLLHIQVGTAKIEQAVINQVTLGRRDVERGAVPDIDLAPHGALENGVSRVHALIRRTADGLYLSDLNSTNGTLLNNQKLEQNASPRLREGDTVQLGGLALRIYFI